jgi:hypothetical protein
LDYIQQGLPGNFFIVSWIITIDLL